MENLFVHQPKIDFIENEKLATSVAYAQAADILGHDPLAVGEKKEEEEPEVQNVQKPESNDLGFVAGVDILENAEEHQEVKNEQPAPAPPPVPVPHHKGPIRSEDYAVEIDPREYVEEEPSIIAPIMPKIKVPKLKLPKLPKMGKNLGIIIAAIVIALLLGLFIAGQTLASAQVNVKVTAKQEDGNFSAKVVPGGAYDKSQSQIPGQVISGKASGTQKATASGSKQVGTKAKGNVNILNCDTAAPKTFPAQSEIINKDGLKFTLDNDVTVPPRVGGTCGQTAVNATAEGVGGQYNINTTSGNLDIVGYDSAIYDASVNTAFAGGDEKQATVASQADLDKMAKSLTDDLTQKARDDLKAKSQNANIADGSLIINVIKKEFDKKADDEASIINLNMEIEANAVSFNQSDLQKLISESSTSQTNFQSRPQDIETSDIAAKRQGETLTISGKYRAKLIPKFEEDQLAGKIAGKSVKETRAIIKQIPEVSDVQVSFSPAIPFVDSIPKNRAKVKFNIQIS